MLKECFTKAQILAAEQLLTLVSPSAAMASQHVQALREVELDEDDIEEFEDDPQQLMYIVKDVADWESVFFVDWKDTESFCAERAAVGRGTGCRRYVRRRGRGR
nr:hypothetical protein [Pseudomonas sp. BIGb0427]